MNIVFGMIGIIGGLIIILYRDAIYQKGVQRAERQPGGQLRVLKKLGSKLVTFMGLWWMMVGVIGIIEP